MLLLAAALAFAVRSRGERRPHGDENGPRLVVSGNGAHATLGALSLSSCELSQKQSGASQKAFCGTLRVPEDRGAPAGRAIDLRLALVPASGQGPSSDLVVFLAGGPGQAAVDVFPAAAASFEDLNRDRHVLLVDQRGTGGSNALTCEEDEDELDELEANFDKAVVRKAALHCLETVTPHADPRFYKTEDAVADLEDVRRAAGGPRVNLVGVSYGTRLAQQYLKAHPEAVRSVILDSAVPNGLALGAEFAGNLDAVLRAHFARCDRDAECHERFGDSYATLYRLRDELMTRPVDVTYRAPRTYETRTRKLTAQGLGGLARLFAYSPETAALLPLTIHQAAAGHYAELMAQADLATDSLGDLASNVMQFSVICAEDLAGLATRPGDEKLILGDTMAPFLREVCAVWPHGERSAAFGEPLATATPLLVLNGELDPVTPTRYGEEIVKGAARSRLIVAKGQGHSVLGRGCLPQVAASFVATLDPQGLDVSCVEELGPMPAFVGFSGATP